MRNTLEKFSLSSLSFSLSFSHYCLSVSSLTDQNLAQTSQFKAIHCLKHIMHIVIQKGTKIPEIFYNDRKQTWFKVGVNLKDRTNVRPCLITPIPLKFILQYYREPETPLDTTLPPQKRLLLKSKPGHEYLHVDDTTTDLEFRIEGNSRDNGNKPVQICIAVDKERCPECYHNIEPAFTSAIIVKTKSGEQRKCNTKKRGAEKDADGSDCPQKAPKKTCKLDTTDVLPVFIAIM
jgi:hypothetical protein